MAKDPDCLHNLIDNPKHQAALRELRGELEDWMKRTNDPMLTVFQKREDADLREAYVQKLEKEALERRANKRKGKGNASKRSNLLKWQVPKSITPGEPATITITHTIPKRLGEQSLHVTLKDGQGKRIERKVLKTSGKGIIKVTFDVPRELPGNKANFALFIGEEFSKNLQHLTSKPIPAE